jgi:hypothetical protein
MYIYETEDYHIEGDKAQTDTNIAKGIVIWRERRDRDAVRELTVHCILPAFEWNTGEFYPIHQVVIRWL